MSNPNNDDKLAPLSPEVAEDTGLALLAQTLRAESDDEMARSAEAGMSAEHGLARLLARVDEQGSGATSKAPSPIAASRDGAPQWVVRTQAAAIVALAASLATVSLWLPTLQGPSAGASTTDYLVYGDGEGATTAPAQLQVVFGPDASVNDMRSILQALEAHVSAGPSPVGAFSLTLSEATGDAVDQALRTLREDDRVLLAEPIGAQVGSDNAEEHP